MFNDLKNLEEFCYFRTITTCMDHKNNPHMFSNENCIISDEKLTPEKQEKKIKVKKKAKEPGIIYLSRVPALMNVSIIRNMFNMYGEVGKIFLQPDDKAANTKKGRMFSEGWIEFEDKKVAKTVASKLNNAQIGGKKKSRWYDEIWNLKYLHRFKWAHLNERLAYERAMHKQRMRTEITQVKREANFYIQNAERNQTMKRIKERKMKRGELVDEIEETKDKSIEFSQRLTEEEIFNKRKRKMVDGKKDKKSKKLKVSETEMVNKKSLAARTSFINKLFSRGQGHDDDDDSD